MKNKLRKEALMPKGVPRYIRIFDNLGKTFDRFTCIFTKKSITDKESRKHYGQLFLYVGMSSDPFNPQGFGQHGELSDPRGGKHLGKRIKFEDLPRDCKKLVMQDYKELWEIN